MIDVLATATDVQAAGFLDPESLLQHAGPWVLAIVGLIVFIESGMLFPFLPGDSLLFIGGMLVPSMNVPLWLFIVVVCVCAILGDQVGYYLGHRFGRRFFKEDARFLTPDRLAAAEAFFAKHGGPSLVLARFVPFVRTYVPLAAGIANYRYRKFAFWNVTGALLWGVGVSLAGFFLGSIPIVRDHVELWCIALVLIPGIPMVVSVVREFKKSRREKAAAKATASSAPQAADSQAQGAAVRSE